MNLKCKACFLLLLLTVFPHAAFSAQKECKTLFQVSGKAPGTSFVGARFIKGYPTPALSWYAKDGQGHFGSVEKELFWSAYDVRAKQFEQPRIFRFHYLRAADVALFSKLAPLDFTLVANFPSFTYSLLGIRPTGYNSWSVFQAETRMDVNGSFALAEYANAWDNVIFKDICISGTGGARDIEGNSGIYSFSACRDENNTYVVGSMRSGRNWLVTRRHAEKKWSQPQLSPCALGSPSMAALPDGSMAYAGIKRSYDPLVATSDQRLAYSLGHPILEIWKDGQLTRQCEIIDTAKAVSVALSTDDKGDIYIATCVFKDDSPSFGCNNGKAEWSCPSQSQILLSFAAKNATAFLSTMTVSADDCEDIDPDMVISRGKLFVSFTRRETDKSYILVRAIEKNELPKEWAVPFVKDIVSCDGSIQAQAISRQNVDSKIIAEKAKNAIELLNNQNSSTYDKYVAINALGELKYSGASKDFVKYIDRDADIFLCNAAIRVAGEVGAKEALPLLIKLLERPITGSIPSNLGDEPPEAITRRAALQAIYKLEGQAAIPVFNKILENKTDYLSVRSLAESYLDDLKTVPDN